MLIASSIDPNSAEVISENITESIEVIRKMSFSQILFQLGEFFKLKLPSVFTALVFYVVGYIVIKMVLRFVKKMLQRTKSDAALSVFIVSFVKIVLYIILTITCIGILGVNFTPLIAAVGALGLALSLAVKDTLGNIASGISLLFSRPFVIDDYVEINGQPGTIKEIGLVYTILLTVDNKKTYLPNAVVATGVVINYTAEPIRRLDLTFSIPESSDYELSRKQVLEIIDRNPLALKDPTPFARFSDHSLSYIKMTIFVWTQNSDLYELKSQLISEIRFLLREQN